MTKTLLAAMGALWLATAAAAPLEHLDRATARTLADPSSHRQPTVVAIWSSDCVHCKKNFGLLTALAKSDKRLQVVTVAAEADSPALAAALDRHRVPGRHYAYGDDVPEALAYALDPAWRGELPRTLVMDGKGGKTAISGGLDEAALRKALSSGR